MEMTSTMVSVETLKELRECVKRWRGVSKTLALVPTMGALHEGHLSLVDCARRKADRVVVSIFVNSKQFAEGEDLATYPRDLEGDLAKLKSRQADLIFIPGNEEMYRPGFATSVQVAGPAAVGLEDKFRPHFFNGVAIVVAKLLIQAQCDYAIFGEKDYQQLKTINHMARDLDIPTQIIGAEIIREEDGLAMSSRNWYLCEAERAKAPMLHEEMQAAAVALRAGADRHDVLKASRQRLKRAGFSVDYIEVRHADTLENLTGAADEPARILAAAWLGTTRLIDNIPAGMGICFA